MASSVEPFSQVSNSSSRVKITGMRSWLIFDTKELGVVVRNANTSSRTFGPSFFTRPQ